MYQNDIGWSLMKMVNEVHITHLDFIEMVIQRIYLR